MEMEGVGVVDNAKLVESLGSDQQTEKKKEQEKKKDLKLGNQEDKAEEEDVTTSNLYNKIK